MREKLSKILDLYVEILEAKISEDDTYFEGYVDGLRDGLGMEAPKKRG